MIWDRQFRKTTREEAITRVMALVQQKERPVLIGEAALAIGPLWTLEDTENLLDDLTSEGLLRKLPEAKFALV